MSQESVLDFLTENREWETTKTIHQIIGLGRSSIARNLRALIKGGFIHSKTGIIKGGGRIVYYKAKK